MIPSCEYYNCQCERCENWHKDCCDNYKIECPKMGVQQKPCDGFKAKNAECKSDNELDFVKVVRCDNCKHADHESRAVSIAMRLKSTDLSEVLWCNIWDALVKKNGFCNYGKKETED